MEGSRQRKPADDRDYLLDELERLRRRRSVADLSPAEALRAMVPFDNFTFSGLDLEGYRVGRGVHLETDLARDPLDVYWREGFVAFDPILKTCTPDTPMASWAEGDPDGDLCEDGRRVVDFFHREGVASRTIVTLWNQGRFYGSATFLHRRAFSEDEKTVLSMLAEPIHAVLSRPALEVLNRRLGLSKGEIACLRLAKEGLTAEEIAAATDYRYDTVNTYLKTAAKKLGASNRTQAVAEAIHRRLIG